MVFPLHFSLGQVMRALMPHGGVWSTSLLPSPTLISLSFCFFFPPTPFLLKFPFPLFHITGGVILGLAMQECLACARRQGCGVLVKAAAVLPAPERECSPASRHRRWQPAV